jgi:hypothetical protein
MSTYPPTTGFVNILVFVKPSVIPEKKFDVTTVPTTPIVTEKDTVINYQIFDSSGLDIVFTGMTVLPLGSDQVSNATVSLSGKTLTFSDANTKRVDLSITLQFLNKSVLDGKFEHDPQITNNPPV